MTVKWTIAARMVNGAAGLQAQPVGVAPITRDDILVEG